MLLAAVLAFLCIRSIAASITFSDFFIGGISSSFWSPLMNSNVSRVSISPQCRHSLSLILSGINDKESSAFVFLDASSKSIGVLEGTTTSMGDYDQCLAIDTGAGVGKYCMIESTWNRDISRNEDKDKIRMTIMKTYPVAKMYNIHESLCVPETCSQSDIRSVIDLTRAGLGLRIQSMNCTTMQSNSLSYKLSTMKPAQTIALVIVVGQHGTGTRGNND